MLFRITFAMVLSATALLAQPPVTQPPVTQPPVTPAPVPAPMPQPPVTPAPVPAPAPMTQPPVTTPPAGAPPMVTPPATTPPATTPPAATPPVAVPTAPTPPPAPTWPTQIGGKDLAGWIKEFVESKDGSVREMAVKVIPQFGPAARTPALKPLLRRLGEETDPGVRVNIILVLGMIGADKPEEAKSICEALNGIIVRAGPGSPVRLHATRGLSGYGPTAAMAIATLDGILEDPAWETRQTVAMTLGRIGRSNDPKKGANTTALNALTKRLPKEESAVVRLEIAQSLLLLGPPAYKPEVPGDYPRVIKPYLDIVTKKLEGETDDAARIWLMMVQMQYDGNTFNDTTIARIADNLNKPDLYAKYAALRALALLGERAKPAIGTMITLLRHEDLNVVAETISAMAALKAAAKDALPDLERIKAGTNEALKQMATEAITIITKAPAPPPVAVPPPPKK